MKKKWMGWLLACSMVLGNGATVCAEDYKGDSGWTVNFTGSRMESNFNTSDINDAIYNLQPGDSIEITVALQNTGGKETDWWMTNKVLRSLEDSQKVAASGGYSYVLTYRPSQGEQETLYSSDTVGGDRTGDTGVGQGLHEATQSLDEYFYLDTLKAGEQGSISLRVALDGETQGNTYQDTLANLTLNFAVEERRNPVPVNDREGEEPGEESGGETPSRTPPKTGDDSNLMLYVYLSLGSGLGLLILALYGLHKAGKKGGCGR
ncbi:MAG: sortase B protein-sorting domain-containing protein [Lachnospiraceae bacterium]|nr:sortase B protein-sorting domain-containing protein [Lachnospiraceae bacterium]